MSIEKKIADSMMNLFGKAKAVETVIVNDIKKVEQFVVGEAKTAFDKTRADALAANVEVDRLKDALQSALTRATQLHQAAIDAASAAQAAAEADVARFKALAAAHAADLATQAGQIIAPAPAPVVEVPAETTIDAPAPQ